jgi:hypothetical protein
MCGRIERLLNWELRRYDLGKNLEHCSCGYYGCIKGHLDVGGGWADDFGAAS